MARSSLALSKPYLTHPTILVLAALAATALVAFRGPLATPAGFAALAVGMLLFVPLEYVNHRFFLHTRPSERPLVRRAQERLHYRHHKDPDDARYLFGPLWALLPLAALLWLAYLAVLRNVALASLVSAGSVTSYLYYEYAHFVAHSPVQPRTAWGRRMKAVHLWHHHKNEYYWFGVTTPAADHVAGTFADVHEVPQSETVREIERSKG